MSFDLCKQPGWQTNHANSTHRSAAVVPWPQYLPSIVDTLVILTLEGIAAAVMHLPKNAYGAVILLEHRWALGLQQAFHAAGGLVLDSAYISPQTHAELTADLEEAYHSGIPEYGQT